MVRTPSLCMQKNCNGFCSCCEIKSRSARITGESQSDLDKMESPDSLDNPSLKRNRATNSRSLFNNSRTPQCAVYAIVFLFAVAILGQMWAFERRFQFFSIKSSAEFSDLKFLQNLRASLKSKNDSLAEKLDTLRTMLEDAAKCLPQTHENEKLELSDFPVSCLREVILGKSSEDQSKEKHQTEDLQRALAIAGGRLRRSVQFLPLKDEKVPAMTDPDRTWFMSTLRGRGQNGDPELYSFPSEASDGKVLCVKGRDGNGALNSYGFAWPEYLPANSTFLPGLSLVADNYWDYNNPWHSMTALIVAVAWRMENRCVAPDRFVLYQNGGLVRAMGGWITTVLRAALDRDVRLDPLEYGDGPVCFERALVYRRGLGHMSLQKRLAMFDAVRCKARKFCNISDRTATNGTRTVNLTLLARTGPRSFQNESAVVSIMAKECQKFGFCSFRLLHISNLSFCEQVEAMGRTDILATVHGAQLTNMMFLPKESRVMEMFPKAWLEGAGVGQYIYHWLASWTGMNHEGTYRDTQGPPCPNPDPVQCFIFYKDRQVAHNETFLAQWTARVLAKFHNRTASAQEVRHTTTCACDS